MSTMAKTNVKSKSSRFGRLSAKFASLNKQEEQLKEKLKATNEDIPESVESRAVDEQLELLLGEKGRPLTHIDGITPVMEGQSKDVDFIHLKLESSIGDGNKDESYYLKESNMFLTQGRKWRKEQRIKATDKISVSTTQGTIDQLQHDTTCSSNTNENIRATSTQNETTEVPERKTTDAKVTDPALAGLRVIRGPGWKHGNEDGGEGHVGTVQYYRTKASHVDVVWDNGNKGVYSTVDDARDLLVLDSGPAGMRHLGYCGCCQEEFSGFRWMCQMCHFYNICTQCYGIDQHNPQHTFCRFDNLTEYTAVGATHGLDCQQSSGIYEGATVITSDLPVWNESRFMEIKGEEGEVEQLFYRRVGTALFSYVKVTWMVGNIFIRALPLIHLTVSCIHGSRGRVEVIATKPAKGWKYYKSHLPILDEKWMRLVSGSVGPLSPPDLANVIGTAFLEKVMPLKSNAETGPTSNTEDSTFKSGDIVRMRAELADLVDLEDPYVVFHANTRYGIVSETTADKKVWVYYGGQEIIGLESEVLTKVKLIPKVKVASQHGKAVHNLYMQGDIVYISDDIERMRECQPGHGGWKIGMEQILGKIGCVVGLTEGADVRVFCQKQVYQLNVELVVPQSICFPDYERSLNFPYSSDEAVLCIGDVVRVIKDKEILFKLQDTEHGGWQATMRNIIGQIGVVMDIRPPDNGETGVVDVFINGKRWTLHQHAVIKIGTGVYKEVEESMKRRSDCQETSAERFPPGQLVKMYRKGVRDAQDDHGGWREYMAQFQKDVVGSVNGLDPITGDVIVLMRGQFFLFNPNILERRIPLDPGKQQHVGDMGKTPRKQRTRPRKKPTSRKIPDIGKPSISEPFTGDVTTPKGKMAIIFDAVLKSIDENLNPTSDPNETRGSSEKYTLPVEETQRPGNTDNLTTSNLGISDITTLKFLSMAGLKVETHD